MQTSYIDFLKRTLIVVAVATIPVLIWYLSNVILMVFGAIILAQLLRLGAEPLKRWIALPAGLALAISILGVLAIIGGAAYLFGTQISGELQDVIKRIGAGTQTLETTLQQSEFGRFLLNHMQAANFSVTAVLSSFLALSSSFIEALVIVVICGIYIAAQPRLYRDGLVQLFPPQSRPRAAQFFDGIAEALQRWLLGQLLEMILIGALSTFAVWLIGVPSPLALGLIAGIGEFIPYLGPLLAAVPAVLVALTKSPEMALWTLVAYLVIHQIEGQLIGPLIQRRMVSIPPAVMLLGIVAITYLFGMVAIIFAAPIAVVVFAAVNLLYVHDTLGESTELTRTLS